MLTVQERGLAGDESTSDLTEYEILDGERGIITFIHRKGSGLAGLLYNASRAVEQEDFLESK